MAAGTIISVLSNIPWGQVVENAPKVADGAAKLWGVVTRKKTGPSPDASAKATTASAQSEVEILKQRLAVVEEHVLGLEEQMSASAGLIKALAEQNTQLVQKVELSSIRQRRFAVAAGIAILVLLSAVAYLLLRP